MGCKCCPRRGSAFIKLSQYIVIKLITVLHVLHRFLNNKVLKFLILIVWIRIRKTIVLQIFYLIFNLISFYKIKKY
jgi:hypothetical protein